MTELSKQDFMAYTTSPPPPRSEAAQRDDWRAILVRVREFIENSSLDEDEMEVVMNEVIPGDD